MFYAYLNVFQAATSRLVEVAKTGQRKTRPCPQGSTIVRPCQSIAIALWRSLPGATETPEAHFCLGVQMYQT